MSSLSMIVSLALNPPKPWRIPRASPVRDTIRDLLREAPGLTMPQITDQAPQHRRGSIHSAAHYLVKAGRIRFEGGFRSRRYYLVEQRYKMASAGE